ncbi:hypothetical protein [Rhodococcus sp. KRD197]|uniref:hypothetical protein n=1 Tax=Rhodococcus sp. KRD197 TaxID=2729731 RepID=UPI0019CFA014|nr:hypothetical protein [Rhodococcus sp. KRD197]
MGGWLSSGVVIAVILDRCVGDVDGVEIEPVGSVGCSTSQDAGAFDIGKVYRYCVASGGEIAPDCEVGGVEIEPVGSVGCSTSQDAGAFDIGKVHRYCVASGGEIAPDCEVGGVELFGDRCPVGHVPRAGAPGGVTPVVSAGRGDRGGEPPTQCEPLEIPRAMR